jgi:DNA-binding NtrC family response regulator
MSDNGHFKPIVCIADDEEGIRFGLSRLFSRAGYEVIGCETGAEVVEHARTRHLDVLLLDVRLSGPMDGHAVLQHVRRIDPELPVLIITGYGTIEQAVSAMKDGAADYIVKPVDNARLLNKVGSRLELGRRHPQELGEAACATGGTPQQTTTRIVCESAAMRELLSLASRIKDQDINVLLTGESGVGKELFARYIHEQSPRRDGPFIGVNCAAFSETLLSSELFGHEKGAFTGADRRKQGCFERSHGGTLFLDEIGDMASDTQAKLLRVLEYKQFDRLGGTEAVSVDARIIAATNQDLERLVEEGAFREDLYYRINVVRMHLPPLRERPEDLKKLIYDFTEEFNRTYDCRVTEIDEATMERLMAHSWPGNARELRNVISQSVLLSTGNTLELFGLGGAERGNRHAGGQGAPSANGNGNGYHERLSAATEEVGRRLVVNALRQSGGNKSEAARILGVTRKTLQRKIARFGIDPGATGG